MSSVVRVQNYRETEVSSKDKEHILGSTPMKKIPVTRSL
jgi:hypothetical protein